MRVKKQIIERYMEQKRFEEVPLVIKEMMQYLRFYITNVTTLKKRIELLEMLANC